jgi:hypothetical protein
MKEVVPQLVRVVNERRVFALVARERFQSPEPLI